MYTLREINIRHWGMEMTTLQEQHRARARKFIESVGQEIEAIKSDPSSTNSRLIYIANYAEQAIKLIDIAEGIDQMDAKQREASK